MLTRVGVLLFGLVFAANLFAQNNGCTNSGLIYTLGNAGPTNFTVFSMGGQGSLLNLNLATVNGPVGVANPGAITESAPSVINGNIIVGSQVNTTRVHGAYGSIIINDILVAQAVSDANNAAQYFAGLASTPAVQAQFPSNGQIALNLTVTGTVGVNVVNLPNLLLTNNATLTLTGPAGTAFVINDWGYFNLHAGSILANGGVEPMDIIYNVVTPNATVKTMVPTTAVGVLLAPNSNINSMDSAAYTGEIIGGYGKTIVLMSGSVVTNPCQGPLPT